MSYFPVIWWDSLCTLKEQIPQLHESTRTREINTTRCLSLAGEIRSAMFYWLSRSWPMWIRRAKHLMEGRGQLKFELQEARGVAKNTQTVWQRWNPTGLRALISSRLRKGDINSWSVPLLPYCLPNPPFPLPFCRQMEINLHWTFAAAR
jgi:hypothetical protein